MAHSEESNEERKSHGPHRQGSSGELVEQLKGLDIDMFENSPVRESEQPSASLLGP